jgi:phage shock protein A
MFKQITISCFTLIFVLAIFSSRTLAQSTSSLESRLSRLESENLQLRTQINTLDSQLSQLRTQLNFQTPSSNRQTAPQVPPSINRQVSSSDPMFKRLATLVVELGERVKVLETQVAQLKKQSI